MPKFDWLKSDRRDVALLVALICATTQHPATGQSTVLPTDTLALPGRHKGPDYLHLNASELKILQGLPAKLYFNFINESSFRLESNPFQTPTMSQVVQSLMQSNSQSAAPTTSTASTSTSTTSIRAPIIHGKSRVLKAAISSLATVTNSTSQTTQAPTQSSDAQQLSHVYDMQQVFREQPNLTMGWQFTPRLSTYTNYFLIRDVLMKSSSLNSTTQSLGAGIQYDYAIGKKLDLQPNFQFREMWQTGQPPVFDYLPAVTLTERIGQATSAYINVQSQLRGRQPFVAPNAEIDGFYTAGLQTQKGRWQGSASCTFLQNFRNIFGSYALLPANSYGFISDFELDRQIFPNYQGLQAFIKAEPLWNFHSHYTVGLSGFDFRLYYGLRWSITKPPLSGTMSDIRKDILRGETGT